MGFWKTVGGRLLSIPVLALLGFLVLAAVALSALNHSLIEGRQNRVVAVIDSALSVVKHYQSLAQSGALTEEQAKQQAMAAVKVIRYDGTEYIWINDMHPNMVMHPTNPRLDGTDISANTDADGVRMFEKMVQVVRADGAGFVVTWSSGYMYVPGLPQQMDLYGQRYLGAGGQQREDDELIADELGSGEGRHHHRDEPGGGEEDDVDFRVAEEPEQVLPQQAVAAVLDLEEGHAEGALEFEQDRAQDQRRKADQHHRRHHQHVPGKDRHAGERHAG